MNLTLSVDDEALERARQVAQQQGTSLNELVRRYIASLAGMTTPEERAAELLALFENEPGDSGGRSIRREDAYEGRA